MGLLDRLFRRKPAPATQALAMVLLGDLVAPDPRAALAWHQEHSSGLPPLLDLTTEGTAATAAIPGGVVGIMHVPAPVPARDLEGPIAVAWHWPEAGQVVPRHQSHIICFATSTSLPPLELKLLHTSVVAALAATSHATAIYAGDAMLVREAGAWLDEARAASLDDLPLLSWVGFNPVTTERGHSAYTTGLSWFNLLELEVRDSNLAWPALLSFMADIANYQVKGGVQIGDGETVGGSETERIRVRHQPSQFIPDRTVAVIER